jgi:hypothetical protein
VWYLHLLFYLLIPPVDLYHHSSLVIACWLAPSGVKAKANKQFQRGQLPLWDSERGHTNERENIS